MAYCRLRGTINRHCYECMLIDYNNIIVCLLQLSSLHLKGGRRKQANFHKILLICRDENENLQHPRALVEYAIIGIDAPLFWLPGVIK